MTYISKLECVWKLTHGNFTQFIFNGSIYGVLGIVRNSEWRMDFGKQWNRYITNTIGPCAETIHFNLIVPAHNFGTIK